MNLGRSQLLITLDTFTRSFSDLGDKARTRHYGASIISKASFLKEREVEKQFMSTFSISSYPTSALKTMVDEVDESMLLGPPLPKNQPVTIKDNGMKVDKAAVPQPPYRLTRFTLFKKLPIELRLKIWKMSLKPRVIEMRFLNNRRSAFMILSLRNSLQQSEPTKRHEGNAVGSTR